MESSDFGEPEDDGRGSNFFRSMSRKQSRKVDDGSFMRKMSRKVGDDGGSRRQSDGGAVRTKGVKQTGKRSQVLSKTRSLRPGQGKALADGRTKSLLPDDDDEDEGTGMVKRASSIRARAQSEKPPGKKRLPRKSERLGGKTKTSKSRGAGDEKAEGGGKSKKPKGQGKDNTGEPEGMGGKSRSIRAGLSRSLTRDKADPKLARTKTGVLTMSVKQQALLNYPDLALEQFKSDDAGRNLVLQGANSMRAEVLDMVTMALVMDDNRKNLTHDAVERFFDWIPLFGMFMERYFFVEEDVLVAWVIEKEGPLRGKLKAGTRMRTRGEIQKLCNDIADLQDIFTRSLPAGERVGKVITAVEEFAEAVSQYFMTLVNEMSKVINKHYDRSACDKLRSKWVRHVSEHIGTEDFLVLYTRWMPGKDLREWKAKILLRTEFKFVGYSQWERDMDYAHFRIVAEFAERLHEETHEENDFDPAKHRELMRQQSAAMNRANDGGLDDEYGEDDILGAFDDGLLTMVAEEEVIVEQM